MAKDKVCKLRDNGNIIRCPICSSEIWIHIYPNEFKCLNCCYSFLIKNKKEKAQNENKSGNN